MPDVLAAPYPFVDLFIIAPLFAAVYFNFFLEIAEPPPFLFKLCFANSISTSLNLSPGDLLLALSIIAFLNGEPPCDFSFECIEEGAGVYLLGLSITLDLFTNLVIPSSITLIIFSLLSLFLT